MENEAPSHILTCPKCGGVDTRRSRHSGLSDAFHRALSQHAWRCRTCKHRFYAGAEPALVPEAPKEHSSHRSRRKSKHKSKKEGIRLSTRTRTRLIEAGLFFAMLIVFYLFLRYITQEQGILGGGDASVAGAHLLKG